MSILKIMLTTALWAGSTAAFACPCPDKAIPLEVLAPQITDVAEVPRYVPPAKVVEPKLDVPARIVDPMVDVTPAPAMPVLEAANTASSAQVERDDKDAKMAKPDTPKASALPAAAQAYQDVLQKHISPGADGLMLFNYAAASSDGGHQTIKDYVTFLTGQDPSGMSANQATAFWANLYNGVTLDVVLDNYPVKSIKKIGGGVFGGGPWKKKIVTVNGTNLSLDDIEHETLRKKYPSPYIHYMVNCASIGCPNLRPTLWQADTMDAERKKAAGDYINSSRGVSVNGSKLTVSSIYDWFQEDFGGSKSGVIEHLKQHAKGDLKTALDGDVKISGFAYDWNLNE